MPNVSNSDLMDIIRCMFRKINVIERKLDTLLEGNQNNKEIEFTENETQTANDFSSEDEENLVIQKNNELSSKFTFSRISNTEELLHVSMLIKEDEEYLNNLRYYIKNNTKGNLEDIFTEGFIILDEFFGVIGRKKFENLVPFEMVYAYLKRQEGKTEDEIKKIVGQEIHRVKKRVSTRIIRHQQSREINSTNVNELTDQNSIEPISQESNQELQEETQPLFKIEIQQEFFENYHDETIDEPQTSNSMDDNILFVKTELNIEDTNDLEEPITGGHSYEPMDIAPMAANEIYKNVFDFTPIKNDKELREISDRLESDEEYLNALRQYCSIACKKGIIEQLFNIHYLQNFNVTGNCRKRKITETVPYSAVYVYLKECEGLSAIEIENEARIESRRIRKRLHARDSRRKMRLHQTFKSETFK